MKHRLLYSVFAFILPVLCFPAGSFFVAAEENAFLPQTPDAGDEYLSNLYFLGESTTAHLKSRGVLPGGTATDRVLTDGSFTMMLSPKIPALRVTLPDGKTRTVEEYLAERQPPILVLSFGLNGILSFSKQKGTYLSAYQSLIDSVRKVSPDTVILLQTVYPVRAAGTPESWRFSLPPEEINQKIDLINSWLPSLAEKNDCVRVVDTASVLRDNMGMLSESDCEGDGIHLTAGAYKKILFYLRTHACEVPEI